MLLINGQYIREGEDGNRDCVEIAEKYVSYDFAKEIDKRLASQENLKAEVFNEYDEYERLYDGLWNDSKSVYDLIDEVTELLKNNASKGRLKTEALNEIMKRLKEATTTLDNWI